MENLKDNLSRNLTHLRKSKNLTQSELAEKLNYSDKTVSKWENGDAIPDVETLVLLSEIYGVSLDSLVSGTKEEVTKQTSRKDSSHTRNKVIITMLAVSVVWLLATVGFVYFMLLDKAHYWMMFIWAIPVSMIVLLVFNSIWGKQGLNFLIISVLLWTILLAIYLQILVIKGNNVWYLFVLGAPIQVATILWSQIRPSSTVRRYLNRRKNKE